MTIGQKAARVLQFLLGLRNLHVALALRAYGFDEAELTRGWDLLRGLTQGRLDVVPVEGDPMIVQNLDAWENKWYPITDAVLASNFPAVHEVVFRNLAQTSGPAVIVTVGILLDRLELVSKSKDQGGMGREGKDARDLLTKRGLTAQVVDEARTILAQANTLETSEEETAEETTAVDQAAEDRLWSWYLEWSRIARTVIKDRRQLRVLGFLRRNEAGEDVETPETDTPTTNGAVA